MRRLLATVALCTAPLYAAAQVEVVSAQPDSVSVTIYRDLFALVTETRTIDLPAEPVTLAFDGVVETLLPASAVISALDRGLEERNYDYDQLAPASLLRKSIGRTVVITRTLPGSGKVTQTRAVIESANDDGVMLRTTDGLEALSCSGTPEGLTFEEIPDGLQPKPRLSIRLAAGQPGKRTIKLSYIAQGFAWRSDYVAHLDAGGRSFDLTGWVTLRNVTQSTLKQAEVQVVAGRLNLLYEDEGGTSTIGATSDFESETELQEARQMRLEEWEEDREDRELDLEFLYGCYPFGKRSPAPAALQYQRQRMYGRFPDYGGGDLEEVVVTGMRASIRPPEALADYHLYRVPWPTDLNARQTKQAVFLQKTGIRSEQFYGFRVSEETLEETDEPIQPELTLGFTNSRAAGIGEPLPAGMVRAFMSEAEGDIFIGEALLDDKPVGVPIELALAGAMDLALEVSVDEDAAKESDEEFVDVELRVSNAKGRPVTVEVRQQLPEDIAIRVERANHRTGRKFGDYVWRLKVPANSVESLTYRLREAEVE